MITVPTLIRNVNIHILTTYLQFYQTMRNDTRWVKKASSRSDLFLTNAALYVTISPTCRNQTQRPHFDDLDLVHTEWNSFKHTKPLMASAIYDNHHAKVVNARLNQRFIDFTQSSRYFVSGLTRVSNVLSILVSRSKPTRCLSRQRWQINCCDKVIKLWWS